MRIFNRIGLLAAFFLLVCLQSLHPQDVPLLQTSAINRVMKEIFAEHLDRNQMTPELTQNAVQLYIDHFDPSRVYLLASEVQPYLEMSSPQLKSVTQKIEQNDFSIFGQLDELFQKAIYRARSLRHLSSRDRLLIFQAAASADQNPSDASNAPDEDLKTFADRIDQLKQRWDEALEDYAQVEMQQTSVARVLEKQRDVLEHWEENMRHAESLYLYLNLKGAPFSPADKQNIFSLHILKALAAALDPHSAFFDNTEALEMKSHLDKGFEGIGIIFYQNPDGFIIKEVIPDSPAAKSGLVDSQDEILAINGEKLSGKSLEQVMELMHGQHDQPITLLLKHQDAKDMAQVVEVKLTAQKITLNSDRTEWGYRPFADGILGWITLHSFYEGANDVNSAKDIQNAITDLKTRGDLKGLILDLRDNGGGYLTQAVKVASLFIDDGVIVVSKYNDGSEHFYRDIGGTAFYSGPLIVLTSRLTASAAEIVAQALQDYGVALVVGDDRTFGKGTIQAQTVTNDNSTSYFKVTVGKYYTVSGKTTQLTGVKSDIEVPGPYSHLHVGEMYLKEALPNDKIEPAYNDKLQDVDPFVREWYLRYYVPSIQHQVTVWKDLVPILKDLSGKRLKSDGKYQTFINQVRHQYRIANIRAVVAKEERADAHQDPQLVEAFNILQDMNRLTQPSVPAEQIGSK